MSPPADATPPDADVSSPRATLRALSRRLGLRRRLGVDARALAAFRISLGLLVVADLLFRVRELRAFYTDAGVLPRAALAEASPLAARLSLHALSGSTAWVALLFAVAGCLAVALTVGYRTRAVTFGVAVLQASLYARNPSVLNGGDTLLVLALFLGIFVPLGERWSLDALRSADAPRERVASLATATLLAQLLLVYLANAAFKFESDAWTSGNAVRYVMELEQFSVGLGPQLTAYPDLLVAINWLWLGMLVASPLLVLATGRLRTLVVAAFVAAHVGMLATMRLGLFPLVVSGLLVLYLPSSVWDRVERRVAVESGLRSALEERLDGRVSNADGRGPGRIRDRVPPSIRRGGRVAITAFLAVVLVASVLWPATAVGVVDASEHDAVPNPDGYSWKLFAPQPPTVTRWFVAPTTLSAGERVDAIDGDPLNRTPPPDAADAYPNTLWHRYLSDVRWGSDARQDRLAAYFCRTAGTDRSAEPTNVTVYVVERPIDAVGGGDPERTRLVQRNCSNGA